jgi:hypothetical protein
VPPYGWRLGDVRMGIPQKYSLRGEGICHMEKNRQV